MSPILWTLVNLVVLIILAVRFGREPANQFLRSYEKEVDEAVERAERGRREAKERLARWREGWEQLDVELDEVIEDGRESSRRLQQRTRERARREREHLKARARISVEREHDKAFEETRWAMSQTLVSAVSRAMRATVTADDHRRLVQNFITEVGDGS